MLFDLLIFDKVQQQANGVRQYSKKDYAPFIDYVNTEITHYKREVLGQKSSAPSTSGSSAVDSGSTSTPSNGGSTSDTGSSSSGGSTPGGSSSGGSTSGGSLSSDGDDNVIEVQKSEKEYSMLLSVS